MDRRTWLDRLG